MKGHCGTTELFTTQLVAEVVSDWLDNKVTDDRAMWLVKEIVKNRTGHFDPTNIHEQEAATMTDKPAIPFAVTAIEWQNYRRGPDEGPDMVTVRLKEEDEGIIKRDAEGASYMYLTVPLSFVKNHKIEVGAGFVVYLESTT